MGWVLAVAAVAGLVAGVDRLVARWAVRRTPQRRPERWDGNGPRAFGAFGELFEVYHPSYHHVAEERERQRLEADHTESGAPPLGIDLDAGTARFSLRGRGGGGASA